MPTTAQAAELDAITSVEIVEPATEVHLYDTIRLEATWAVPDTAQPGDTFSLTFPTTPSLVGVASAFQMLDPDGATIGTCTVVRTGITCTLSDYVLTHDNVQGNLFFQTKVEETTEEDTLTFTTGGGDPIIVNIPGGGILPQVPNPVPTDAIKSGVQTTTGGIEWYVWVPGNLLSGQNPTITDTYTEGLTLLPNTLSVGSVAVADWNDGFFDPADFTTLTPAVDYTLTPDASAPSFTVALAAPAQADRLYRLLYQTQLPADAVTGDVFNNTITGTSFTTTTASVTVSVAGGGGDGDGLGGFTVAKQITGDGASLIPDTATFLVDYSYTVPAGPVTGTLTLAADGTSQLLQNIPVGTVVTLTERPAVPVEGVVWGAPVFSGTGVTVTDTGAQLTIGDAANIAATLANPTTLAPVPLGGFSVAKQVTGDGAELVPDTAAFLVDYSYTGEDGPVAGTLTLTADGTVQTVEDIPEGTVVTLTERPAAAVEGVVWGAPVFSGTGVTATDDGAQLTIGEATTVAVGLSNPTTLAPTPLGGFSVSKQITGPGAALVPDTATFLVDYSYTGEDGPVTGTLTLAADGTVQTVEDIPEGTVVTLTERAAGAVSGVAWGTPVFAGEGVTAAEGGAQLTIGADTVVAVELTNPTTITPPSPSDPPAAEQPPVPPRGLAITGGDAGGMIAVTASAVLALAAGALLLRRSAQRRELASVNETIED
ncbi:DUF5979 domain-containing protein [Zhihengliuella sp. ISTPL4]|uniref:DUF5979 domain-containing protein n=1 Tax=Zhihengliuella sp. ISTPL4 TaxID=2058657 RepID=UPI000C7BC004|nr:DUF5979 domain-containing protein [Zhihengliuella sp. ISTPL4]